MHRLLIASTVLAGLAGLPALTASQAIASEPLSKNASNIDQSDTHSAIAPQLPAPPEGGAHALLQTAMQALDARQTGLAQESLERAETRVLTRTTAPDQASAPDNSGSVQMISSARTAIAHGDLQSAKNDIQQALGALPQEQASD